MLWSSHLLTGAVQSDHKSEECTGRKPPRLKNANFAPLDNNQVMPHGNDRLNLETGGGNFTPLISFQTNGLKSYLLKKKKTLDITSSFLKGAGRGYDTIMKCTSLTISCLCTQSLPITSDM